MANVLLVYGSSTGNTATLAELIGAQLSNKGHTVSLQDAATATAKGLCAPYDAVLFGCSTWGTDEIELQPDFEELYERFDELEAHGKKVAVFGCGDMTYTFFCGAVDQIQERLESMGATLMTDGLKVDGDPNDVPDDITSWAEEILNAL